MVHTLRCMATSGFSDGRRVAGKIAIVPLICLAAATLSAGEPGVHYLHQGAMPPGAIGSRQLQRGGPLPGFFQPVEIKAPTGALISLAVAGQFDRPQEAPVKVGTLIGQVYRLRVMKIPRHLGMEVFPTVEVIDRIYAPAGQEQRFAIPVELTQEDLQMALAGKFVTRVIYLEDPRNALPIGQDPKAANWFDVGPKRDPLAVADALGRPVAILRLGGRLPDTERGPDMSYLFGCPPFVQYSTDASAAAPIRQTTAESPWPPSPPSPGSPHR